METTKKTNDNVTKNVTRNVINIHLEQLKANPVHSLIYSSEGIKRLIYSIRTEGLKQPIVISRSYDNWFTILSGHQRVEAMKSLGMTEIEAIVDNNVIPDDFGLLAIQLNQFREKTVREKWEEIKYLRKYFGNRQGHRTDLKGTSDASIRSGQTTKSKISEILGISESEIQRIEKIATHDEKLFDEIDRNEATVNQVFQEIGRVEKEKESTSKIKNFVTTVKAIITSLFFKLYLKSSFNMSEVKSNSVNCICMSIPYYKQRIYSGDKNEIGQEATPDLFIQRIAGHLQDCKRVLKDDGSMFINIGDSIIGKRQQLIPEKIAIELEKQGWFLRQRMIWRKTTSMYKGNNSSFTPQCESIIWMTKGPNFAYNDVTVPLKTKNLKPGTYNHKNTDGTRRKGSPINTKATSKNMRDFIDDEVIETASCNQNSPFLPKGTNHAAPFPVQIPNICIAKVCKPGDTVLDPFCGSGTTGEAALMNGCNFIGYDIDPKSVKMSNYRLRKCQKHIAAIAANKTAKVRSIVPVRSMKKAA